jgi:hypothetical protein
MAVYDGQIDLAGRLGKHPVLAQTRGYQIDGKKVHASGPPPGIQHKEESLVNVRRVVQPQRERGGRDEVDEARQAAKLAAGRHSGLLAGWVGTLRA